jgi:dGTPase
MVTDVIECSWAVRGNRLDKPPDIGMSTPVLEATNGLRDFLFEHVYNVRSVHEESARAREVVRLLYDYFNEHEDRLPAEYCHYSDETERRVVDYIAGMTDHYALRTAEELALTRDNAE